MNDEFKLESIQDRESIIQYLNALKEGFESGRLSFSTKQRKFEIEPQGLISFNVKAKRKDRKIKLELKLAWEERKEEKPEPVNDPLVITGK